MGCKKKAPLCGAFSFMVSGSFPGANPSESLSVVSIYWQALPGNTSNKIQVSLQHNK